MTAQRWGILSTAIVALIASIISVLQLSGAINLTNDAIAAVQLVFVNASALVGALFVTPPSSNPPTPPPAKP